MYVNDLVNALVSCDLIQYADDTALVVKAGRNIQEFNEVAEKAVESALDWFSVNRLDINVRKTTFMMFGKQTPLTNVLKVGNQIIPRSDNTVYLGLRLDGRLTWTYHINYVVSRIRHIRIILSRFSYMFDRRLRIYLCKALIFPVISMYDFVYSVAPSKYLTHLNTAYNQLMRTVLGFRQSERIRINDMYTLSGFEPLTDRRQASLLKFMHDVKCERHFSKIRTSLLKMSCAYEMRSSGKYVIPSSRTSLGQLRISVRGLRLLN
jgi:hypothetical protein